MPRREVALTGRAGGTARLLLAGASGQAARMHTLSVPLSFPSVCIWGANTGVGKTLFSAGLAAAAARAQVDTLYLKPVQTGFPADSDARLVAAVAGGALVAGPHAAALLPPGTSSQAASSSGGASSVLAKTLYAWRQALSPHVAVQQEGRSVSDREVVAALATELSSFATSGLMPSSSSSSKGRSSSDAVQGRRRVALVETAGGVASPGPAGALQCDLLRPLRLPGLLVGDGRLGGISATLSALDSLLMRGYDVPLVVLMEAGGLGNSCAIQAHLGGRARVLPFPLCEGPPTGSSQPAAEAAAATASTGKQHVLPAPDANLQAWLDASAPQFDALLAAVAEQHERRLAVLGAAAAQGRSTLWWPFTQHGNVHGDAGITVIDSRAGESFAVFQPGSASVDAEPAAAASSVPASSPAAAGTSGQRPAQAGTSQPALVQQYDGCASWWTQGLSAAAQPALVAAVAAAAGRYGHVMFPENVHEPALELAGRLLDTVGQGWASRVFFSDNGSTAIEVALKMAFRTFMVQQGLLEEEACELQVLGLQEGYHGDTLGAMDAVSPSPYNGRLQSPWFSGRGLFLDPPTAGLVDGEWSVVLPAGRLGEAALVQPPEQQLRFGSREQLFGTARDTSPLAGAYRAIVEAAIEAHEAAQPSVRLGACIMEPVLQGAGGMRLIDPLFQREMVRVCRARGIPIIFDEVFTGFWRLGERCAADALGVLPDIACYAKLLTGGLLPLAATLASPAVFAAFESDSKLRALLHGHSYTAHAVGCAAGGAALRLLADPGLNHNLCTPERCGQPGCGEPCGRLLPLWDKAAVAALSRRPDVARALALGSVLALELAAPGGGGYASNAAARVVARLRGAGVYARPLGNVVYLMVTPMTERQRCAELLTTLAAALDG